MPAWVRTRPDVARCRRRATPGGGNDTLHGGGGNDTLDRVRLACLAAPRRDHKVDNALRFALVRGENKSRVSRHMVVQNCFQRAFGAVFGGFAERKLARMMTPPQGSRHRPTVANRDRPIVHSARCRPHHNSTKEAASCSGLLLRHSILLIPPVNDIRLIGLTPGP